MKYAIYLNGLLSISNHPLNPARISGTYATRSEAEAVAKNLGSRFSSNVTAEVVEVQG